MNWKRGKGDNQETRKKVVIGAIDDPIHPVQFCANAKSHRGYYRTMGDNHMPRHRRKGSDRFKHVETAWFLLLACSTGLAGCSTGMENETIEPDDPIQGSPIQYRILAFGDSITAGNGTSYGGYTYYLEDLLNVEERPTVVINAGVGGELTWEGLGRFESTLRKWKDPPTVLLMEGANDVTDSSGAGPLGSIVGNLREMIHIARDDHALQVVLGTVLPRRNYGNDQESPTTSELVAAIRDLAEEEDVLLADHYQNFLELEQWEGYFSDAVHPNHLGYQVLADSWYEGALEYLFP
jgi:lysophospholipase L1-like esterase